MLPHQPGERRQECYRLFCRLRLDQLRARGEGWRFTAERDVALSTSSIFDIGVCQKAGFVT